MIPGQLELIDVPHAGWTGDRARLSDPHTSHAAAGSVTTAYALRERLLTAFRGRPGGLTAEEAAALAGIDPWAASKRVSDLVRDELLIDSGRTRTGRSGRAQRVLLPVHQEVSA